MTMLLQAAWSPALWLNPRASPPAPQLWTLRSPAGTLCLKARGLSPQHDWERTPCMCAAKPCFPCLPSTRLLRCHDLPPSVASIAITGIKCSPCQVTNH